jgi:outer membrane protein assembly factor BamB
VKGDIAYANGRVFLQTGTEVICLSQTDGSELWRKRIDQISQTCNLLVVNDLLIVNTEDQHLYALETSTGNTRWKIGDDEQSFRNPSKMMYHDGKIYFTSESKFNCIHANDGQVILNDFSPSAQMMQNSFLGFRTVPVIDETRNQIIINDNFFVMGLPIP